MKKIVTVKQMESLIKYVGEKDVKNQLEIIAQELIADVMEGIDFKHEAAEFNERITYVINETENHLKKKKRGKINFKKLEDGDEKEVQTLIAKLGIKRFNNLTKKIACERNDINIRTECRHVSNITTISHLTTIIKQVKEYNENKKTGAIKLNKSIPADVTTRLNGLLEKFAPADVVDELNSFRGAKIKEDLEYIISEQDDFLEVTCIASFYPVDKVFKEVVKEKSASNNAK